MQAATRELEGKSISYKNELLYSRGIDYDQLSNEIYTAGLVKPGPLFFCCRMQMHFPLRPRSKLMMIAISDPCPGGSMLWYNQSRIN